MNPFSKVIINSFNIHIRWASLKFNVNENESFRMTEIEWLMQWGWIKQLYTVISWIETYEFSKMYHFSHCPKIRIKNQRWKSFWNFVRLSFNKLIKHVLKKLLKKTERTLTIQLGVFVTQKSSFANRVLHRYRCIGSEAELSTQSSIWTFIENYKIS